MIKIADVRDGRMIVDDWDKWIAGSLIHLGEYVEAEAQVLRDYALPGTVAIDVGANIGATTLTLSRAVGAGGVVLAAEPQHLVWQLLVANVAVNKLRNVIPLNVAVGSEIGKIRVPDMLDDEGGDGNTGGLELWRDHDQGRIVPLVTVDSIVQPGKRVSLIKVDVEGMEPAVLLGAKRTIEEHRPVVYFEADRENWQQAAAVLFELGYRIFRHRPPLFRADNFAGRATPPWEGNVVSFNALALHVGDDFCVPKYEHIDAEILQERWFN